MNCKACNNPLEEGGLFCKKCGKKPAFEEQQEIVNRAKKKADGLLLEKTHSPLVLVFTILFSAMLLCYVFSTFLGGLTSILGNALSLAFLIATTVGWWKTYAARDKSTLTVSLRRASCYDGFVKVIITILYVIQIILCAGLVIVNLVALINSDIGSISPEYTKALVTSLIVTIFACGASIVLVGFIRSMYKNRRNYFLSLKYYTESGSYYVPKAPVGGSIFLGIVLGSSAISSIVFSSIMSKLINGIIDSAGIGDMGIDGMDQAVDAMIGMFGGASFGKVIGGISTLLMAAYYICSAIWMASVHNSISESQRECNNEIAKLKALEKKTNDAISAYNSEKLRAIEREKAAKRKAEEDQKKAQEDAQRKAEEDARKTKEAMQEQQMMMMQMMMQQMMANSVTSTPTVTTPAEGASDDKLLTLQREKEAAEERARIAEEQQQKMMEMMQQMMANSMNASSATDESKNSKK